MTMTLQLISYWPKFHVNIITGSGIMTIFFNKELTRNPEKLKKIPVWGLPNIWRVERVSDTKYGLIFCNKLLLNAAKYLGYRFYRF